MLFFKFVIVTNVVIFYYLAAVQPLPLQPKVNINLNLNFISQEHVTFLSETTKYNAHKDIKDINKLKTVFSGTYLSSKQITFIG